MKPRDKELKSLLRERPDDLAAICELCNFYLERDRFGDAEKWVMDACRRHPGEPSAMMMRAELLLRTRKVDELPAALDAAEASGIPEPLIESMRGLLASQLGQRDVAVARLTRALELKPDLDDSRFVLAGVLATLARWEEVRTHCEELLRGDRNDAETHALMAEALLRLERLDRAKFHAEKALGLAPDLEDAAVTLAAILCDTEGEKAACESLAAFVDAHPRSAEAMRLLVTLYEEANYLGDAIDVSRRLVRLDPADPDARLRLAHLLQRIGHREEAIEQARRVLGSDGGFREARILIAALSIRLKRHDEAERHLDALDAEGPDTESLTLRGQLHAARGRTEAALESFRAAIRSDGECAAAWAGEAMVLETLERHEESLERIRKAIELEPHQPVFHLQLSGLLHAMGRTEEANAAEAALKSMMGE